jgi:hypothetical protein
MRSFFQIMSLVVEFGWFDETIGFVATLWRQEAGFIEIVPDTYFKLRTNYI